jgi:hypothetical protein
MLLKLVKPEIKVLRENIDHFLDHIWVQRFDNDDQGT